MVITNNKDTLTSTPVTAATSTSNNTMLKLSLADLGDSNKENDFNQNNIISLSSTHPPIGKLSPPLTTTIMAPVQRMSPRNHHQHQHQHHQQQQQYHGYPTGSTLFNQQHQHHQQQQPQIIIPSSTNPFSNSITYTAKPTDSSSTSTSTHLKPLKPNSILSQSMPSLTFAFQQHQHQQQQHSTPNTTPRMFGMITEECGAESASQPTPIKSPGADAAAGGVEAECDIDGKPLKKHRNSQNIYLSQFTNLSINQGTNSPLSRSVSDLPKMDLSDSDLLPRSVSCHGGEMFRRDSKQLNFDRRSYSGAKHSPASGVMFQNSISSPPSPHMGANRLSPTPGVEPFSLSAPNSFLLTSYPRSPEPSPATVLFNTSEDQGTPVKFVQAPNFLHLESDQASPPASSPPPSTPNIHIVEANNNVEASPYKTPSKVNMLSKSTGSSSKSFSGYVPRPDAEASQNQQNILHSLKSYNSSGINKMKKRTRYDQRSLAGDTLEGGSNSGGYFDGSCNNNEDNVNKTTSTTSTTSTTTTSQWIKASPKSKPLPFDNNSTNNLSDDCLNGADTGCLLDQDDYKLKLPICNGKPGYNNILPETLSELMDDVNKHITVIDCRYAYEYNGGHINNAINIPPSASESALRKYFFPPKEHQKKMIIIFHCEFSSKRAPDCYTKFRDLDRTFNEYPNVHYPETYLLSGGYKRFFECFPQKCFLEAYIKMDDPKFAAEKKKEEEKKKKEEEIKKRLGRSKSVLF
ncbi:hypothetical protein SAMD00019534_076910 [Acytostelium subglobosum LB1]|uniref:hypothetical protein n=1 Tax=Acytostelium subglobosum LB1 TaxID=1410327 RepID=UPI00064516A2|nr:hypothetical protein SAMD00019534_076910 [Acytostelium subglobosum LB1]GAM24516.1 hypothetical protein SAMD00019534_076910 [Acytostelium subglobosum LB1]|eukprot:XP_012752842.1 hypothetical protein SAMD00019534_076910 [Acytostelium subglobosum LB1]